MSTRVISVAILLAAMVGCSYIYGPVKEVDAYTTVKEPLFDEMQRVVKAEPNEAGVEKARKLWESKKADLKAKYDAIQAAPQGKNSDWQGVYFKSQERTRNILDAMVTDVSGNYSNPSAESTKAKMQDLQKDVETTLRLR
jgi:hypothetical protein